MAVDIKKLFNEHLPAEPKLTQVGLSSNGPQAQVLAVTPEPTTDVWGEVADADPAELVAVSEANGEYPSSAPPRPKSLFPSRTGTQGERPSRQPVISGCLSRCP